MTKISNQLSNSSHLSLGFLDKSGTQGDDSCRFEDKMHAGFGPYDDEMPESLPSVIPPPKVQDQVSYAEDPEETVSADTSKPVAKVDIGNKFESEVIKILEATFVKYEINRNPTHVYAELM